MKAVTIRQPWASLMAFEVKRMETRSWRTNYRGPVAIHAGASLAGWGRRGTVTHLGAGYSVERDRSGLLLHGGGMSWPYRLPLGEVIAVGDLMECRSTTSIEHGPDERELALGDHSPGRFAWSIVSMRPLGLRAVPATGALGLWDWEPPDSIAPSLRPYWTLDQLRGES